MKTNVLHHKDDPSGLHLFLVVPAGNSLEKVPPTLGTWKDTGVCMDLCPMKDINACVDIGDNGFALFGSGFILRLPAGTVL